MPIARQNAEKAIQSDPFNAEALTALAFIVFIMIGTGRKLRKGFSVSLRSIPTMHQLITGIAIFYRM